MDDQSSGFRLRNDLTEPLPIVHPFWEMPNVIVTSHQSGDVIPEEVVALFGENIVHYRRGQPLVNEIDLERGYCLDIRANAGKRFRN